MEKLGFYKERIHATGLQTLLKLIESDINSTPLGVTMARTSTNTPLLKLITPDHLRMGRISNRAPVGPFQPPNSPRGMIARAEELYWRWHEVFNESMLPVLMAADQPKWYNLVHNVSVRYYNASEPHTPHTTDRAVRSLVRLFDVEGTPWAHHSDYIESTCKATHLLTHVTTLGALPMMAGQLSC